MLSKEWRLEFCFVCGVGHRIFSPEDTRSICPVYIDRFGVSGLSSNQPTIDLIEPSEYCNPRLNVVKSNSNIVLTEICWILVKMLFR